MGKVAQFVADKSEALGWKICGMYYLVYATVLSYMHQDAGRPQDSVLARL